LLVVDAKRLCERSKPRQRQAFASGPIQRGKRHVRQNLGGKQLRAEAGFIWPEADRGVAVGTADFLDRASQALVQTVGLDTGRVLLRGGDSWEIAAAHGTPDRAAWRPSRYVLERLLRTRSAVWQKPRRPTEADSASLLLLVFESDIGTSSLFMGLFVAMLYIATSRTSWLLLGFVMFVAGAFAASRLFGHVGERFDIWLHPFSGSNPANNAYQLVQGLYGMASGGLLGKGLGGGQPYITPLVQSDLVFTAFGEELGLAGLMAILLIYGLIVQRGLRTAMSVKDPFSKLLAGGLSFMLALQVFVIVGGVTRLIPLTGITTPFLSQGGSSLVASWMLIALLIRISDTARRPPPRPIQEEGLTQVVTIQ